MSEPISEDFIRAYGDVLPEGGCEHFVKEFERLIYSGAGSDRAQSEGALRHNKNDLQLNLNFGVHTMADFEKTPVINLFFDGLQTCFNRYVEEFSVLKNDKIRGTSVKIQRTDPGGGYHIWHGEQGNGPHAERVLVYMLYLNTLAEGDGGETEFLYQRKRIRPKQNTMLIWPAAFTHAHRGNTVLGSQSKYIVTGWFYYE